MRVFKKRQRGRRRSVEGILLPDACAAREVLVLLGAAIGAA